MAPVHYTHTQQKSVEWFCFGSHYTEHTLNFKLLGHVSFVPIDIILNQFCLLLSMEMRMRRTWNPFISWLQLFDLLPLSSILSSCQVLLHCLIDLLLYNTVKPSAFIVILPLTDLQTSVVNLCESQVFKTFFFFTSAFQDETLKRIRFRKLGPL